MKPLTGTWSGSSDDDLSVRITVTALNGRLAGIYATVRPNGSDRSAQDIRILTSFDGRGPQLGASGSFAVRVNGVSISGALNPRTASGRVDVAREGSAGEKAWKARRVG